MVVHCSTQINRMRPWNILERLLLYGICGLAVEVIFTAVWEAIEHGNRKLHGVTSLYAFPIYGISALVQERLYLALRDKWSPLTRGLVYVTWSYSWEFSSGLFLRQFDACPWDYASYFRGHFMGLVTAEYIPLWYLATLLGERLMISSALSACWRPTPSLNIHSHSD